ncbi:MAG: tRNA (adenosine(37)-N6)-threonylcarbamoyltransferase complex dimerization subunit type 1 TsaB [Patescibacteria group bacterium]|jgi:tRNA threonylcarbamoyladenosine biosynthesis protein TsaB
MILEINTADWEARLCLYDRESLVGSLNWRVVHNHTEELLSNIERILKDAGKKKSDLSAIVVNPGPGPYTGVRVGVSVANSLAFSLDIPVVAQMSDIQTRNFEKPVLPVYAFAPKISQPKS